MIYTKAILDTALVLISIAAMVTVILQFGSYISTKKALLKMMQMFDLEEIGGSKVIHARHGLYSNSFISARGLNSCGAGMNKCVTIPGYAARDRDGRLYFFKVTPKKSQQFWVGDREPDSELTGELIYELPQYDLPSVSWEDSEPTKVELSYKISIIPENKEQDQQDNKNMP